MKRWIIISILSCLCLFLFLLFSNTSAQLHTVRASFNSTQTELESTKGTLVSTKTELESTKGALVSTKTELESTKGALVSTKTELESTKGTLVSTKTELESTERELSSNKIELATTLDSLSTMQAELDNTRDELTELEISHQGLMTGHGYTIKDPSYNEMTRFLSTDDTDQTEYIEGEYECTEFAMDLCNRAEEQNIRCAFVSLRFPGKIGHAIVAFNTIDEGLIYIEPQHDDLVKVEINKQYYTCVVPKSGTYYEKPDYDDTIKKVQIVW
ncbi:hypothetical protein ACFLUZ_01145 [Chloroflexota bacterium]